MPTPSKVNGDPRSGAAGDSSRVAIVTGAAGGIGSAVARRLAASGHTVVGLDAVAPAVPSPHTAWSAVLDITMPRDVRRAVDEVASRFGQIDVLVNSAGVAHRSSFEGTTAKEFMIDVETNLLGTFLMCQAVVFPHMARVASGRIVNIASASGKAGGIGPVHQDGSGGRSGAGYASSKAGVINLTRWIAREVGRLNITSNAVAPGPIRTAMTDGHSYDLSLIPLRRLGTAEDVADAVAWLAGDGAAYVSGTVIDIDGGMIRA